MRERDPTDETIHSDAAARRSDTMEKSDSYDAHAGFAETAPSSDPRSLDVNILNMAQGTNGKHTELERGLKSRHIQFLALGGA